MRWALECGILADALVVNTVSGTWAGAVLPIEVLHEYRRKTGIVAKLIVVRLMGERPYHRRPGEHGEPGLIADFVRR